LRAMAREQDYEPTLLDATAAVNQCQLGRVLEKLGRALQSLEGKRIALLGLSFKPETDDLREAPSLKIARALASQGARVVGYDPVCGKVAAKLLPALDEVVFDPYEALDGAQAAVVVTEWQEIRQLDLKEAGILMRPPKLLVDGRNALDPASARDAGLLYQGYGRG
jgi:UDPglucose 6-dehydrogenase